MARVSLHKLVVIACALVVVLAACGQTTTTSQTNGNAAPTASGTSNANTNANANTAASGSTTGAGTTVRLAYFPNLTHAVAVVGVGNGTFKKALGDGVNLDVKTFNAGPALIEALFAGEVDIGYVGPNPAINGYVKSKGAALRIVAGASSGGASFVVRPEANINGPQDLAGKKFASPQLGGTQDVALRHYIQQNGLQTKDKGGTVEIVPTQNPDILTLFKQGQIDGAWVPEPWASRLVLEGKGKVLVDERTTWPEGKFITTLVVVRKQFLDEHPDLVAKFLAAHVETVQYIQQHKDEAKTLVNSEIKRITKSELSADVLNQALSTTDITYEPLAKTLFTSADAAFDLGFLGKEKPDLSGIYDLKPLNDVLKSKNLPEVSAS